MSDSKKPLAVVRLAWKIRLAAKRIICRAGLGDRLIEFCEDCGREQPLVWWADDDLWLSLVGQHSGAICPECFSRRADAKGLILTWKPTPLKHSPPT